MAGGVVTSCISQSAVRKEKSRKFQFYELYMINVNPGDVLDSGLWYMSVLIFTIHMYFIHPLFVSYIPNHQMHVVMLVCVCASRNTNVTKPDSYEWVASYPAWEWGYNVTWYFSVYTVRKIFVGILISSSCLMNILLISDSSWNGVWQGGYRNGLVSSPDPPHDAPFSLSNFPKGCGVEGLGTGRDYRKGYNFHSQNTPLWLAL